MRVVGADGRSFVLPRELASPVVRWLGRHRVVVVDRRTSRGRANGYVLERDGGLGAEFVAGDGVEDVVVLKDVFAVTYFDEGAAGLRLRRRGSQRSFVRVAAGPEPGRAGTSFGRLRGLGWGRFLSRGEHGFTVVEVTG